MKNLNIIFEDEVFAKLSKDKHRLKGVDGKDVSWEEYIKFLAKIN